MSIDTLWNEVLVKIIEDIYEISFESAHDLLSLAKCSRRLYGLTLPTLYRNFTPCKVEDLVIFTRTIFTTPEIAPFVNSVNTHKFEAFDHVYPRYIVSGAIHLESSSIDSETENFTPTNSENIYVVLEEILHRLANEKRLSESWTAWMEQVKYLPQWSTLALLLCLLPRVKSLRLPRYSDINEARFFGEFIKKISNIQDCSTLRVPPLKTLEKIDDTRFSPRHHPEKGLRTVPSFLALKSLKSFEVKHLLAPSNFVQMVGQAEYTLTEFYIRSSIFPKSCIIPLLKRCSQLEVFHFETDFHEGIWDTDCSPWDIIDGLSHLKHRLRTLEIRCANDKIEAKQTWSLAEFKVLEHLSLEALAVMAWTVTPPLPKYKLSDRVPKSLKSLEFHSVRKYKKRMLNALHELNELVDMSENCAPNLKDIKLCSFWI